MIRSLLIALPFGALLGWLASGRSGPLAGLAVGIFSAIGFSMVHYFARARVRSRQGAAPAMLEGEKALLHGPGEWIEAKASAKAWVYLSNLRLIVKEEGDSGEVVVDLKDIEEVRPAQDRFFSSELKLVAKGHGLITLKLPDAKRWQLALQQALKGAA